MTKRFNRKAALAAAIFLVFGARMPLTYASISVSPVRVDLSEEYNKDVVRISNAEETAKSYEVEVVAWSQTDEQREVYAPTDDVLAVPPLFTLQPGENQLVRIGMLQDADSGIEQSYRMFITEIAPPQVEERTQPGIKMRLQIGIPVFVAPLDVPTSTLDYVDSLRIDGQLLMRFRNSGNTHVKIMEIQYTAPGFADKHVTAIAFYVLAGQSGYLPVNLPNGKSVGSVSLVTDTLGTLEYELPAAP